MAKIVNLENTSMSEALKKIALDVDNANMDETDGGQNKMIDSVWESQELEKRVKTALEGSEPGFTAREVNEIFGLQLAEESSPTVGGSDTKKTITTDYSKAYDDGASFLDFINTWSELDEDGKTKCKSMLSNLKQDDVASFIKGYNTNTSGNTASGFFEQMAASSECTGITNRDVEAVMSKFIEQCKSCNLEGTSEYKAVKQYYESFLKNIDENTKNELFKETDVNGNRFFGTNRLDDIDEHVSTLIQMMEGKNGFERLWDNFLNPEATNTSSALTIGTTVAAGAALCFVNPWIGVPVMLSGLVARWF